METKASVAPSAGYSVVIRNNLTGESRAIHQDDAWSDSTDYLWGEGNYACDCNRALFFFNWEVEAENRWCGHERFTIPTIILSDGTIIEFEDYPSPN